MKIKLPKDLRGDMFSRVITLEMSGFDIDHFLPSLFFAILAGGRGKAKQANNPTHIQAYVDCLSQKPELEGFATIEGRRVLERFVRTTLITTGQVGVTNRGEQITSIVPYTLLAYKPGFPTESSRQRKADTFVYQALRMSAGSDDALRTIFKTAFGRGVIIDSQLELGGTYDQTIPLDTLTRLSIAFLDCFKNTPPGMIREKHVPSTCPGLVKELGADIIRYLSTYHPFMPAQALIQHLLALINFELFHYTLKLVHATNELVKNPQHLPAAMQDTLILSPPQLYLDFTNTSTGRSLEMAKGCVRRDIEAYQQFHMSILLLRQLDKYIEELKRNHRRKVIIEKKLGSVASDAHYLQALLLLREDPALHESIEAAARRDEERIREENIVENNEDDTNTHSVLDAVADTAETDIDRVIKLLAEGQRADVTSHYIPWYWGVGGLKQPHGVLRGSVQQRNSWRYSPTNDLLAVFVQLAAAKLSPQNQIHPIRLQEFLEFLEHRFGILIDRPPLRFQGAEYTAEARENLRAMLHRLRQMGIFRDLSDDFTVQRLHPPYASTFVK